MKKYQVLAVNTDNYVPVKKPIEIKATEDVFVINGDDEKGADSLRDVNFGDSQVLEFKADSKSGKLFRRVFLKFDISDNVLSSSKGGLFFFNIHLIIPFTFITPVNSWGIPCS